MKKYIALFLIIQTNISSSQSLRGTYVMEFFNGINEKSEIVKASKINPITYGFAYSNNKSRYSIIESKENAIDSVEVVDENGEKKKIPEVITTATNNTIYKDSKQNLFRKEYTKLNSNFSIKDELPIFDWNITDETTNILGYLCKKAVSKKEKVIIVAWFCDEIPINTGPDRFWGLPGLIMKVEIGKFSTITIDKLKLVKEELVIEEPINKEKFITLKELKVRELQMMQERKNEY